jgi:hypothetical protein
MKEIETILEPITGYLVKIIRNPQEGWYEMEVGIPNDWVFNENNEIGVEVITETDLGKILKIFPKSQGIGIDDLVLYVIIVINTNKKIAEKQEEFKRQLQEMKRGIEERATEYFKQMDELKENSFKKLSDNFLEGLAKVKKPRKKRTPKPKGVSTVSGTTS